MASFNDLPDDVLWLIFQPLCVNIIKETSIMNVEDFEHWKMFFHIECCERFREFALINKKCKFLFRKKCFKFAGGWLFRNGALTYDYFQ
jgi:hypothetical protein